MAVYSDVECYNIIVLHMFFSYFAYRNILKQLSKHFYYQQGVLS